MIFFNLIPKNYFFSLYTNPLNKPSTEDKIATDRASQMATGSCQNKQVKNKVKFPTPQVK
jgi:hypothetical protein